jgi:hypothetical protein
MAILQAASIHQLDKELFCASLDLIMVILQCVSI